MAAWPIEDEFVFVIDTPLIEYIRQQGLLLKSKPEQRNLSSCSGIITHMSAKKLSHLDESGQARMVDVGHKPVTERMAIAKGQVIMRVETLDLIQQGALKKGDVLSVAQLAGVMAAKHTSTLIPLCHPLPLDQILVEIQPNPALPGVEITSTVRTSAKTGVEMEALTAVTVAALTVYDMAKAVEKTMRIENIRLVEKRGGRSGDVLNE
jgi:cyclic pyranopterin phosphate synthase